MFSFDGTIHAGDLITVVSMIGVGAVFVIKQAQGLLLVKKDVGNISDRLDKVDEELKKQTEILISLGKQDVRLSALETQIALVNQHILVKGIS